jgi:3-keto-5-aminohexanoate cleavage enzyme
MLNLIVNFTPTGMVPTRAMTPHVPITVNETVEQVQQAVEIGITVVHLHARDERTGEPTCSADVYGRIIEGVRRFAGELVICVSLSGRRVQDLDLRAQPLRLEGDLKPDMGSLTLGSMNFADEANVNAPATVQALAGEMKQRGILPELEAFDPGMINYAKYLERKGMLSAPHYFNLLLGGVASAQADPLQIGLLVRELPPRSYWSLAGIGDAQVGAQLMAVGAGGGVRVGLEDSIWWDSRRTRLASNSELLRRVRDLAALAGRSVMAPDEFRTLLRLQPGSGRYGRLAAADG